jgi:CDP-paratose 2-epimerase
MRILITGICGFAGSTLARSLLAHREGLTLFGIDNLSRPGSETNLAPLRGLGCRIDVADLRDAGVLERHPPVDWLIDAAANPSVLAGLSEASPSRELMDTNLVSTLPMLEFCTRHRATFTLLSTSRVYSIRALRTLPFTVLAGAFHPGPEAAAFSEGIPESFPTTPPVSLYGASKLCAETLALEYGETFQFPVWINRCGVLAGAGQFGRADQGIFSYWIHRWAAREPLRYLGFGGQGLQVRDCLHPRDLTPLLLRQQEAGLPAPGPGRPTAVLNVSGGMASATSLLQLSAWCTGRLGPHAVERDLSERPFDLPWVVLDSALARSTWNWYPETPSAALFEEIATHALQHPRWGQQCGG